MSVIEAFLMRLQSVMTQQHLSPWANVSCWKLIKQIWFWQPWTYFQQTWKIMANWPFVISAFLELKYSTRRRNLLQNVYIPGGGPSLVSVRLIIIGTFVAKLRAAWSSCGHIDYLYNVQYLKIQWDGNTWTLAFWENCLIDLYACILTVI